ncbi:hypothetical protein B0O99DRAFT_602324 [Bisporella sp. PMI_857]|nr:hypothetical protein B0O99DRAFT_602324 [Bisporella sp. PMI_857]
MLYRRVNGAFMDANDSNEVVKYINGTLKVKFELDTTFKSKPVAKLDDLLFLLVQHWARNEHVFPTKDDRYDVATILLFQFYTGGRPAEFVYSSKGKASEDPLKEVEETKNRQLQERKKKHNGKSANADDSLEYDDNSAASDGFESNNDFLFDSDNDETADKDDFFHKGTDRKAGHDSGYSSGETDVIITENTNDCYPVEVNGAERLVQQNCNVDDFNEFKKTIRKCKALCYENICFWIVKNPKQKEQNLLAMEVYLRHHKKVDNKPKPTTFLFRENSFSIFCPISHILARAIRDNAIFIDGYTSAGPFFATNLRSQRMKAIKVHWKPEWLKRPVFRRSVRTVTSWVKSKTKSMTYSTYCLYIDRFGKDTGFEDKLTTYCFRRGTANAIDAFLSVASDAVRDQIMRHDPFTGVFNGAYINHIVRFNVQNAFLESDVSDNRLTRAFTHMSIRCNPSAPKEVPNEVMERFFAADPDIRAPKEKRKKHEDFRKQLTNTKKSLRTEIENVYRKDYFFQIYNEIMKKQLQRHLDKTVVEKDAKNAKNVEPVVEHQLEKRTQLQQVFCDFFKHFSFYAIVARKVSAINLIVTLASRQKFQTRKPRSALAFKDLVKKVFSALNLFLPPDEFPIVCKKTQCILCIGNERLSYMQRTRTFKRVSHMWDYVENIHLCKVPVEQQIICNYPVCKADGLVLDNVTYFKNHVATVYKIDLRPRVFP